MPNDSFLPSSTAAPIKVVDDRTLAFPNYNGNGMYMAMGNILETSNVGLLFINWEKGHRLRLHGSTTIDRDDEVVLDTAVYTDPGSLALPDSVGFMEPDPGAVPRVGQRAGVPAPGGRPAFRTAAMKPPWNTTLRAARRLALARIGIAVFGSTGPSDRYSAMPSMNHSGSASAPAVLLLTLVPVMSYWKA